MTFHGAMQLVLAAPFLAICLLSSLSSPGAAEPLSQSYAAQGRLSLRTLLQGSGQEERNGLLSFPPPLLTRRAAAETSGASWVGPTNASDLIDGSWIEVSWRCDDNGTTEDFVSLVVRRPPPPAAAACSVDCTEYFELAV